MEERQPQTGSAAFRLAAAALASAAFASLPLAASAAGSSTGRPAGPLVLAWEIALGLALLAAYVLLAAVVGKLLGQREQLDRLRYAAEHDALTGVLNRATFRTWGHAAIGTGVRTALVVVDVDRFREVNDALGHQAGDAVLAAVASALTGCARAGDVVARLGGDTFGLLLPEVGDRDDVERRIERYAAAFDVPLAAGERAPGVPVTACFGIAVAPDDGTGFEQVLARADAAVFAAKQSGRARWSFFEPRIESALAAARLLRAELGRALAREEFELHFQPHVELATRRVCGAEALVRWNHPERGLLAPAEFVPFAEEHGIIGAIGAWVMRETVRASRAWRAADPSFRVWFNLSAVELDDPALVRRLHALGDDLRGVGVEITESVAMRDVQRTLRSVAALREAGLAIALDDFGTGYSSLAYLKRLPLDVVKIDRVFVAGVPGDAQDEAIVDAVLGIGRRFGFAVLAEGVETGAQAAWLDEAGCTYAQGFRFAAPMSAAAFDAWLAHARNTGFVRA